MRRILLFAPLLLLSLTSIVAAQETLPAFEVDGGLLPPGSAGDLVADTGVPSAADGPIPYVIVTSRALRPAFLELGRERIRHGIRSAVRSLEGLRTAYPDALDDPDRIRQFLRDAHDRWGTQAALLGGDTDVIPARYVTTPSVLGERHFVSDWYYACLDGTWDADHDGRYAEGPDYATGDPGDQADRDPELGVGRAPVSSPAEARAFVDRTIRYEERPADAFENTTLLFANRLAPFLDLAGLAEQLLPAIVDDPAQVVTRLYQSFDDPAWAPGALPETPAAVVAALDEGANVTIGFGAGSEVLLEAGDRFAPDPYLTVPAVLGLTNGDRVGHVLLLTSLAGAFDTPISLAEAFLRAQDGGAVTVIAPSDLTLTFMDAVFARNVVEAVYDRGVTGIAEALASGRVNLPPNDPIMPFTYNLLGDPLLRVFHASPVAAATGAGHHGRTEILSRVPAADQAVTAIAAPSSSGPRPSAPAAAFTLHAPAPSPATTAARIVCEVPAAAAGTTLRATVHDLAGRALRSLAARPAGAGTVALEWDLRDDRGARVGAGVYFVRAGAGAWSATRRLIVTAAR